MPTGQRHLAFVARHQINWHTSKGNSSWGGGASAARSHSSHSFAAAAAAAVSAAGSADATFALRAGLPPRATKSAYWFLAYSLEEGGACGARLVACLSSQMQSKRSIPASPPVPVAVKHAPRALICRGVITCFKARFGACRSITDGRRFSPRRRGGQQQGCSRGAVRPATGGGWGRMHRCHVIACTDATAAARRGPMPGRVCRFFFSRT